MSQEWKGRSEWKETDWRLMKRGQMRMGLAHHAKEHGASGAETGLKQRADEYFGHLAALAYGECPGRRREGRQRP